MRSRGILVWLLLIAPGAVSLPAQTVEDGRLFQRRALMTEFKEVGRTKVDVPAEARVKFER